MRINFYYVVLCLISIVLTAGRQQAKLPPPPGTFQLAENLFADEDIINNRNWLEFLHYSKADSTAGPNLNLLPDTSINRNWTKIETNPEVLNFPVTGITREQANSYCLWRSKVVSEAKTAAVKAGTKPRDCKGAQKYYSRLSRSDPEDQYKIVYRLPTQEEFNQLAAKISGVKAENLTIREATGKPYTPKHVTSMQRNGLVLWMIPELCTQPDNELVWLPAPGNKKRGEIITTAFATQPTAKQEVTFRCIASYQLRSKN